MIVPYRHDWSIIMVNGGQRKTTIKISSETHSKLRSLTLKLSAMADTRFSMEDVITGLISKPDYLGDNELAVTALRTLAAHIKAETEAKDESEK